MDGAVPTISYPRVINESLEKKGFVEAHNTNIEKESLSFVDLSETVFGNAVEAALEYHRRGLMVTPLHGKRPVLKNWQQRELSTQEISHYFGGERNVGIVLGGLARIADVDLDIPVAITIADLILPDSMESGREKSPRSHRWFISDPAPPSRRYSLTKSMAARLMIERGETTLIELRGAGQLTMVPPSIHPVSGDRCLWYPSVICEIDGEVLAELVLDVAIAALLVLNRPLGSREWFAIHAAGYLNPRVGRERTEAIVNAASSAFDDEEHDERMWAVRSSLQKPISADPTIDVAMAAELERLAPGVPDAISHWYERGRRHRGGAR
jgi:hypothetical protein